MQDSWRRVKGCFLVVCFVVCEIVCVRVAGRMCGCQGIYVRPAESRALFSGRMDNQIVYLCSPSKVLVSFQPKMDGLCKNHRVESKGAFL